MKRILGMILAAVMVATAALAVPGTAGADARFVVRVDSILDGSQEVPAVATERTGRIKMRIDQDSVKYRLLVAGGTSTIIAAHIHCAAPGSNGPVGISLFGGTFARDGKLASGRLTSIPENSCDWSSPADVAAAIHAGAAYVNVHTSEETGGVPSGEIRGDLTPSNFRVRDDIRFDGSQEVPAVDTDLRGRFKFKLTPEGLRYRLSVRNNTGEVNAAHIHCAAPGDNGPVGISLFGGAFTGEGRLSKDTVAAPDDGNGCGWTTLDDVAAAIERGAAYVNVHTSAAAGGVPSGEIRGNLG